MKLLPVFFLLVALPLRALDRDHDGMSDVWQRTHSIATGSGNLDPDQDGQNNLVESEAGTDPHDPQDRFITSTFTTDFAAGTATITWRSVPWKYYEIEKSTSLAEWSWATYETGGTGMWTQTTLNLPLVPQSNDLFALRTALPEGSTGATFSFLGAGFEANEPKPEFFYGDASLWWVWRAAETGDATLSLSGGSYNCLSVYSGEDFLDPLNRLANSETTWPPSITFPAVAEESYLIQAVGYSDDSTSITLTTPSAAAPVWETQPRSTQRANTFYRVRVRDDAAEDDDRDGLISWEEHFLGTDKYSTSTDGDPFNDGWEFTYGFDPLTSDHPAADADNDQLSLLWEYKLGLDPTKADTDGDGIPDKDEDNDSDGLTNLAEITLHGTDPTLYDTDADHLPDGWELAHGLNPLTADSTADPDSDGLSNLDEYLAFTDPHDADSDDDGENDGAEYNSGKNPNDPTDGGQPPPDDLVDVPFKVYGDYASWEMTVAPTAGQGGKTEKVISFAPGIPEIKTLKHKKGVKYEVTLKHTGSKDAPYKPWYCWEAKIDMDLKPEGRTFQNYESTRLPGLEFFVVGEGNWLVDNRPGLFTDHVDQNTPNSGNIAGGLKATLYPIEIVGMDKKPLAELKVGKLYPGCIFGNGKAEPDGATAMLDNDPDRFYVRVKYGASLGDIQMKFETVGNPESEYDDPPTIYTLKPGGQYTGDEEHATTKAMLLVSDDVDDDHEKYTTGGKPDENDDDRTHKIQLGGKLRIHSIKPPVGDEVSLAYKHDKPVLVKKTVRVQMVDCSDGEWETTNFAQLQKILKERFAQTGIKFDFPTVATGPEVADIDEDDLFDASSGTIEFSQRVREIIDGGPANDWENSVMVYLIAGRMGNYGGGATQTLAGMASPLSHVDQTTVRSDGFTDRRFANKIFISGDDTEDFTLSHEMVHVLCSGIHATSNNTYPTEWNARETLWFSSQVPLVEKYMNVEGTVGRCKRISLGQESAAQFNPLSK